MDILATFYNEIVNEACNSEIKTGEWVLNIGFATVIEEERKYYKPSDPDGLVPFLYIKNKRKFDELLVSYVELAKEFYHINDIKIIMGMMFADMTTEDFNNPCEYIKRKINFINDDTFKEFIEKWTSLGFSNILNGNIEVKVERENVYNETPYHLIIKLIKNGYYYDFPLVRFGVSDGKIYMYAIQQEASHGTKTSYQKKVNRNLYKIGEGFDIEDDNCENYGIGNLKDISASFLVALNIALGLSERAKISDIEAISLRIVRWNSKVMAAKKKNKAKYGSEEDLNVMLEKIRSIQTNLSEKFIRTFLRLSHHNQNLEVTSYPFEVDSNLHIKNNGFAGSNNKLLDETYNIALSYEKERGIKC